MQLSARENSGERRQVGPSKHRGNRTKQAARQMQLGGYSEVRLFGGGGGAALKRCVLI